MKESFLGTWQEEESKRDFLHRLFPRLEASGDAGLRVVNLMADSLIQQETFPDLVGWEDSKQKIVEATAAVKALRVYREAQKAEAASEMEIAAARRRAAEISAEIQARKADLTKLENKLTDLSKRLGTPQAGYDFQVWFYELADYFEVPNRRPYVVDGRQIDGSVTVDGTTYLVELKFTREQADAPDVDTFLAKVSAKADNTMGVMFSISAYSSVAIKGASGPKGLLLLFDYNHIYMLFRGGFTLQELVSRVRRHASQTGEAYIDAKSLS